MGDTWGARHFCLQMRLSVAFYLFLDASSHLYKRVCPSIRPSVVVVVVAQSTSAQQILSGRGVDCRLRTHPPRGRRQPPDGQHTTTCGTEPATSQTESQCATTKPPRAPRSVGRSVRRLPLCSGVPVSNSGWLWMALRNSW